MAARPPGGGDTDEPEAIEFGIAALDARIDEAEVSFPATAAELRDALGDQSIPYDAHGRSLTVSDALDRVPQREFENETALLNALYPVFDEARREERGVIASLRDALPF
ncbi:MULTISPECIES: hypothetical protein [Halorubrum]|uniref:Uncharacterized protein n=1 Tax=Halorubrum hochstenium ATCC 700873 TaxID=1227481 RepID=M0F061_9EURY|nr:MULTISPECIES: hypothetical protein [Halorubrum]ELZ53461.1 hypothetical protein C467_13892 [Halorubrum hochstenium ATCC 700873]